MKYLRTLHRLVVHKVGRIKPVYEVVGCCSQ